MYYLTRMRAKTHDFRRGRGVRFQGGASWRPDAEAVVRWFLHRSEQYRTFSQSRAHFFRQVKGRWQVAHSFVGKSDFLRISALSASRTRYENLNAVGGGMPARA